jgi:hypothetical protein
MEQFCRTESEYNAKHARLEAELQQLQNEYYESIMGSDTAAWLRSAIRLKKAAISELESAWEEVSTNDFAPPEKVTPPVQKFDFEPYNQTEESYNRVIKWIDDLFFVPNSPWADVNINVKVGMNEWTQEDDDNLNTVIRPSFLLLMNDIGCKYKVIKSRDTIRFTREVPGQPAHRKRFPDITDWMESLLVPGVNEVVLTYADFKKAGKDFHIVFMAAFIYEVNSGSKYPFRVKAESSNNTITIIRRAE